MPPVFLFPSLTITGRIKAINLVCQFDRVSTPWASHGEAMPVPAGNASATALEHRRCLAGRAPWIFHTEAEGAVDLVPIISFPRGGCFALDEKGPRRIPYLAPPLFKANPKHPALNVAPACDHYYLWLFVHVVSLHL
jgi:hypothetical protein